MIINYCMFDFLYMYFQFFSLEHTKYIYTGFSDVYVIHVSEKLFINTIQHNVHYSISYSSCIGKSLSETSVKLGKMVHKWENPRRRKK